MTTTLHLTFAADPASVDGRRIGGLAVPFGVDSPPRPWKNGGNVRHRFAFGAFSRSIAERGEKLRLFVGHDTSRLPVGRAVELAETQDGLRAVFELAEGPAGDEALQAVRTGLATGFSVGVDPIRFDEDGDRITHTETRLREISLTAMPAFEGATAAAFAEDAPATLSHHEAAARLRLAELDFTPRKDSAMDTTDTDFSIERESLIAEARKLLADADGKALDGKATERFSAIEKRLEELADQATQRPAAVDPLARALPGQAFQSAPRRPASVLEVPPQALAFMQTALREHRDAQWDHSTDFAALTTGTIGTPGSWGANSLPAPRLLHEVAGVQRDEYGGTKIEYPKLATASATAGVAEGASVSEYAASTVGTATITRYGRFTDLTGEALLGASSQSITSQHQIGIAKDLDQVLIAAAQTDAGTPATFDADVPGAIRAAMSAVLDATAADDPAAVMILVNPADARLLQDVSPTGGDTIGEKFQRFSGALVYPSSSVTAGIATVANLRAGCRFWGDPSVQQGTFTDLKTSVTSYVSWLYGAYGTGLIGGYAKAVDIVSP